MSKEIKSNIVIQDKALITGSCQCKGMMFEFIRWPKPQITHCHCSMCRKMHGAGFASWVPIKEKNVDWICMDTLKIYKSSPSTERWFCSNCGSNMVISYQKQEGQIWIAAGTFDGMPKGILANLRIADIYVESKCSWIFVPHLRKRKAY